MRFQFEQTIALPRATVFAFHEDPGHLVLIHRDWAAFRMIRHDGDVNPGSRTWVETTVAGILPIVMGFEHDVYKPPHRFGERMIHGPFGKFTHIHEFEELEGGCVVRDVLEVELPWYYGGEMAMKFFIGPMVSRAFKFRAAALLKLAESGAMSPSSE